MKKAFTIILVLSAVVIVLSFGKNIIVKRVLSNAAEAITGLRLSAEGIDIGIVRTVVGIDGLKIFNPSGFPDRLMADMPEVYVDYDLGSFLRKEIHLKEVRLHLRQLAVVRDERGKVNLDSLRVVQHIKERTKSSKGSKIPGFRIDLMKLKIGRVIYKDYSKGPRPLVIEYNVNIDEQFENITNPYALVSLIVARSLTKTPVARLADFDLGPLKRETTQILKKTTEVAQKAIEETGTTIKETVKKAEGAIQKILPLGE